MRELEMLRNEGSASKERFPKVNFEDSNLFHEMKEQLSFLRDELKCKNEVINVLLKDRIWDKYPREAMPRSPSQTPVVAPERFGCQFRDFHCPALCLALCYSSYLISFQHTYVFSFP